MNPILVSLDYLTLSSPLGNVKTGEKITIAQWAGKIRDALKGVYATIPLSVDHKRGTELTCFSEDILGARYAITRNREEHYVVAQHSGSVLSSYGIANDIIQRWRYGRPDARVTRFDVAIDYSDPDGEMHDAIVREAAALIDTQSTKTVRIWGGKSGNTVYVGSRYSSVMVRIYQKRLRATSPLMCRVEAEIKPQSKRTISEFPMSHLINSGVATTASYLLKHLPETGELIAKDLESYDGETRWSKQREDGKTVKWLNTQVYSAFRKVLEEDRAAAVRFAGLLQATIIDELDRTADLERILDIEEYGAHVLAEQLELL